MSKKNFITLLFFLTVNTSYFWLTEIGLLGITGFAFLLLLFVIYFILAIELVGQLFLIVNERFTDRQRLARATFSTTILTLIYFFPAGFINFQKFEIFENLEKKNLFIAQRESAVSTITFIINQNNKFTETSACFGITETKGDYALKGDTLFFTNVHTRPKNSKKYYKFAIINRLDTTFSELGKIVRYQNCLDTIRHELCITKDDLKNDNSEK